MSITKNVLHKWYFSLNFTRRTETFSIYQQNVRKHFASDMIWLGIIELMTVAYRIRLNDSYFASIAFGPSRNSIILVNISLILKQNCLHFDVIERFQKSCKTISQMRVRNFLLLNWIIICLYVLETVLLLCCCLSYWSIKSN